MRYYRKSKSGRKVEFLKSDGTMSFNKDEAADLPSKRGDVKSVVFHKRLAPIPEGEEGTRILTTNEYWDNEYKVLLNKIKDLYGY